MSDKELKEFEEFLKNNEKIGQISQDKLISSLCEISSKNISQDINLNIIYNII